MPTNSAIPALLHRPGTLALRHVRAALLLRGVAFPSLLPLGAGLLKVRALATALAVLWLHGFDRGSGFRAHLISHLLAYESTREMALVKFAPT